MLRSRKPATPEPEAPGWTAIDDALLAIYGPQDPIHVAPTPGSQLGGGVDGIAAFRADDHWHLVTYGLTELYGKDSVDRERSGWGYELTMRVRPLEPAPPSWAFDLLEQVARQTQVNSIVFGVGHRLAVGGSIDGRDSPFTAVVFALDPQLGAIQTVHGRVEFLQLVGVGADEIEAMKSSSTQAVLEAIGAKDPLLVTDPMRA